MRGSLEVQRDNRVFHPFERLPTGVSLPLTSRRTVSTNDNHQQPSQAVLFVEVSVQPEVFHCCVTLKS